MKKQGFTLVEILIVVIILGILAAIVIPQFTEASNDARESALASDLQMLRSQLELYKVQHNEKLPSVDGAGAPDTANFVNRMIGRTDQDGTLNPAAGAFGPYMGKFPSNPFLSVNADGVNFGVADPAPGDGTSGWYYHTTTGKISANDDFDPAHQAL